jgi:hypothetical protein
VLYEQLLTKDPTNAVRSKLFFIGPESSYLGFDSLFIIRHCHQVAVIIWVDYLQLIRKRQVAILIAQSKITEAIEKLNKYIETFVSRHRYLLRDFVINIACPVAVFDYTEA